MGFRFLTAVVVGKILSLIIQKINKGGTAFPGLVAQKIDNNVLYKLSELIPGKTIIITGTNGKTTIAHLLSHILKSDNKEVLHNSTGSNLERGIIGLFLNQIGTKLKTKHYIKVLEIDEAVLNVIAHKLKPDIILFSSLFRDQLDRYGEVNTVKKKWEQTIKNLPQKTTLILNADDPGIRSLGTNYHGKVVYFGTCFSPKKHYATPSLTDFDRCPICNHKLQFEYRTFAHLGKYICKHCGFKKPNTNTCFYNKQSALYINTNNYKDVKVSTHLRGLYNFYNITAAITLAQHLGIDINQSSTYIQNFKPVFGRQAQVQIDDKVITMLLVKNPTGFSEVVKTYLSLPTEKDIVILLNDKIADGTDVSWIWDADLSLVAKRAKSILLGGSRKYDMALRLIYEGVDSSTFSFLSDINNLLYKF